MMNSTATSMIETTYENLNATAQVYVRPFGEEAVIISGVIIFTFLLVGVVLNSLTIAVISTAKNLRNIFMVFILSLCCSDLISALISPLFWYRRTLGFDIWLPPDFFCKFYWATDLMTSYSTASHILSFALIRYLSIQHPTISNKISYKTAQIWILLIWFVCFSCGFIPFFVMFGAEPGVQRDRFSDATNAKWPACTLVLQWLHSYTVYQYVMYPLFFVVPIIGVVILSALIGAAVHKHTRSSVAGNKTKEKRIKKERQAVLQLLLIVFSFLLGYAPFLIYEVWSIHSSNAIADYWFGLTQYFFLRFSECLNPIFYNIGSSKMRRFTLLFLKKKCACITPSQAASTVSTSSASSHSAPTLEGV